VSHNIRLMAPDGAECDLFQVPSIASKRIFASAGREARLESYFGWLSEFSGLPYGAILDHKILVLEFFFAHPGAEWSLS